MTEDELRAVIRRRCEEESQRAYAEVIGVSPQYLADFLAEKRGPGPAILKALGLRKIVRYERDECARDSTRWTGRSGKTR